MPSYTHIHIVFPDTHITWYKQHIYSDRQVGTYSTIATVSIHKKRFIHAAATTVNGSEREERCKVALHWQWILFEFTWMSWNPVLRIHEWHCFVLKQLNMHDGSQRLLLIEWLLREARGFPPCYGNHTNHLLFLLFTSSSCIVTGLLKGILCQRNRSKFVKLFVKIKDLNESKTVIFFL